MAACYRHPSRETAVSCSSCGRPICPDCMTPTQVRMREMASQPRVTYGLIAVNVLVFLVEGRVSTNGGGTIYEEGALVGSLPRLPDVGVAHGQWWRLVTSGCLHENIIHIGFNMWVLYILGRMLEPALGSLKFAVIYGVSLLTGSLGALLVTPHALTVGASGAVFGVMGAAAVEMRARQIPVMQSGVGTLIVLNLIISFTLPGISWGGHVGGLIGGALAMLVLQLGDRRRSHVLGLVGCAAIAAAAVAGSLATAHSSEVEESSAPAQQLVIPGQ
jgi:membrane associated rhomboid family serine protease